MKKSISINIQGIIFNVEEDGYEKLRAYIDSLRKHFKFYQDNDEILNDIESRIAEIFQSKRSKTKEVITLEDVDEVIQMLGQVSDFEEEGFEDQEFEPVEENADQKYEEEKEEQNQRKKQDGPDPSGKGSKKKFFRDNKRKMLGGVASGMANYFGIDPVFIRVIFIILTFGINITPLVFIPGITVQLTTITVIAYLVLWMLLPPSDELEGHSRLFRDGEDSHIGGVASGIAKYLGVDALYVRLTFIIFTLLGGSGILIYILLWIIVPKARTVSDRVQMQGKPLTVDNIEQKIKDSFNLKDTKEEESTISKIIFFPFRIIGQVLKALGPGFKNFVNFIFNLIRFSVGFGLIATALCLVASLVILLAVGLGLNMGADFMETDFDFKIIQGSIPVLVQIAVFMVTIMPVIFIGLLGVNLLAKKNIMKPMLLGSMFGIWILSIGFMLFSGITTANEFKNKGSRTEIKEFPYDYSNILLDVQDIQSSSFDFTKMYVKTHSDSTIKVEVIKIAQGNSRQQASENASMITYNFQLSDSTLLFDNNFKFTDSSIYRCQRVEIRVYVPENVQVTKSSKFEYTFDNNDAYHFSSKRSHYRGKRQVENATNLEGLQIQPFNTIKISDAFDVIITQSEKDSISISGDSIFLQGVVFEQRGSTIKIKYTDHSFLDLDNDSRNIKVEIWSKTPENLKLNGAVDAILRNINVTELELELDGAASCTGEVEAETIRMELDGASDARLKGKCEFLKVDMDGASQLKAKDLMAVSANIEVSGASRVTINVSEKLKADVSGISSLKYYGEPRMDVNSSGTSSIEQL